MNMPLTDWLVCPQCKKPFETIEETYWRSACGLQIAIKDGKPIFTPTPAEIIPFSKVQRAPDQGTPWRRSNWAFLQARASQLAADARILDVGAGHGDFADIFRGKQYLPTDIVAYDEVQVVCDLTQSSPFPDNSIDVVILMNVLEHVYQNKKLLQTINALLKPGGVLWLAVPFMIKIHQMPYDFSRPTIYWLENAALETGFILREVKAYDDPIFFATEGVRNIRFRVLPHVSKIWRPSLRALLGVTDAIYALMEKFIGHGRLVDANSPVALAAIGYQAVLEKSPEPL